MANNLKKKSLCKWDKDDVKANWDDMYSLVGKSKFICERCLRSASAKGMLCKPEKLSKPA